MGEDHALARDAIKGRRDGHRVAKGAGRGPAPVVGEDEENVGPICGARETQAGDEAENQDSGAANARSAEQSVIKRVGVHKRMKILRGLKNRTNNNGSARPGWAMTKLPVPAARGDRARPCCHRRRGARRGPRSR